MIEIGNVVRRQFELTGLYISIGDNAVRVLTI